MTNNVFRVLFSIAVALVVTAFYASAQEVRVRVCLDREPASGMPVYVNGKYAAATGPEGTALLKVKDLRPGDSISSSVPGILPVCVTYEPPRNEYDILLTSDIRIGDVVVAGKSRFKPRKFFRKYVKGRRPTFDFAMYGYSFVLRKGTEYTIEGTFTYSDLPEYYRKYTGETGAGVIVGDVVPEPMYELILCAVHNAAVLSIPTYDDISDPDFVSVDDISVEGDRRTFSFGTRSSRGGERALYAIVEVDPGSGEVLASSTTLRDTSGVSIVSRSEYAYDREYDVLCPRSIAAVYSLSTADTSYVLDITLTNTWLKRYPRTMPHLTPARSTFRITAKERSYNTMLRNWANSNRTSK